MLIHPSTWLCSNTHWSPISLAKTTNWAPTGTVASLSFLSPSWKPETSGALKGKFSQTRTTANNVLLLSEVIEIICLRITLWAGGNVKPRARGGGSGDNVLLVHAQGSIISASDCLFFSRRDPKRWHRGKTHRCKTPDPWPAAPISDSTHSSCYWSAARWILCSCSFVVLWLSADLHPAVWFTFRLWVGLPASNWLLIVLLPGPCGCIKLPQRGVCKSNTVEYIKYTYYKGPMLQPFSNLYF